MQIANFVLICFAIITLGILYQKYLNKQSKNIDLDDYSDIQKYLLKDTKYLLESDKPILWVHVPYEYNSRKWLDFGSRSSNDLNQPYLYLTMKSIIKNCENSFKVVLIDDKTFRKIIPNWTIDLEVVPMPSKCYIRQLAIAKLIYIYGGVNVPLSFLCFRDLLSLYESGTRDNKLFVCENYNSSISSTNQLFYPNIEFFGADKENKTVEELIEFMQRTISSDFTDENNFVGSFNKWCLTQINNKKMNLIEGHLVGTKTIENVPVTVETLLSDDYMHFYPKTYGIWIPSHDILKRVHYEWFARMNIDQIFDSHFILAKYFVLAMAPDSHMGVIEPIKKDESKNGWIDFWSVPLTSNTLNIFGPKPLYLGNNISKGKPIAN
jgi:hypothetical protein